MSGTGRPQARNPAQDSAPIPQGEGELRLRSSVVPRKSWFDGRMEAYLKGDPSTQIRTLERQPTARSIGVSASQILPFMVHAARTLRNRLRHLLCQTWGDAATGRSSDWRRAHPPLGGAGSLSGEYGFFQTPCTGRSAHDPAGERPGLRRLPLGAGAARLGVARIRGGIGAARGACRAGVRRGRGGLMAPPDPARGLLIAAALPWPLAARSPTTGPPVAPSASASAAPRAGDAR
jgi:hypothetical protein